MGDRVLLVLMSSEYDSEEGQGTCVQLEIAPQTSRKHLTHPTNPNGPGYKSADEATRQQMDRNTREPNMSLFHATSRSLKLSVDPFQAPETDSQARRSLVTTLAITDEESRSKHGGIAITLSKDHHEDLALPDAHVAEGN